jgi:predicted flavoprotein YhiN
MRFPPPCGIRWPAQGRAALSLDLAPGRSLARLTAELSRPQGRDSLANHLRRRVGIDGVKAGLLRELCPPAALTAASSLAAAIKALPLPVTATRPIDEAISTAGGVVFEALDPALMLKDMPGVFCAGEMLDWEAPTGGYLLTGCLASGRAAGLGAPKHGWMRPRLNGRTLLARLLKPVFLYSRSCKIHLSAPFKRKF